MKIGMKPIITVILLLTLSASSFARARRSSTPRVSKPKATSPVRVKGHATKKGTYVMPSVRTRPNKTKLDNYGTKGNYNPYTGKNGTVDPKK